MLAHFKVPDEIERPPYIYIYLHSW